jgi:hypothetical protein
MLDPKIVAAKIHRSEAGADCVALSPSDGLRVLTMLLPIPWSAAKFSGLQKIPVV